MGHAKALMIDSMKPGFGCGNIMVCADCIQEDALQKLILESSMVARCDYCEIPKDKPVMSLQAIIEHIDSCIHEEYTDAADELPFESREGGFQGNAMDGPDLLYELELNIENNDLFFAIANEFNDNQWCRRNYFSLTESQKLIYGWERFAKTVKEKRRFTFWSLADEDNLPEFHPDYMPIGQMLSIISEHTRRQGLIKIVKKGTRLWRGRVHAKCDSLVNDHEFASPPQQFATQPNRMSPAGISMFYGAEDFGTAKIETAPNSPSPGSCFSAVQFESCDDFYILDLVDIPFGPSFFQAGSGNARHSLTFLRTFSSNLSKPIEQDHKIHIEYVPTQAFTEYVRFNLKTDDEMHLSGIRYRSSRNGRPCVVLFMDHEACLIPADGSPSKQAIKMVRGSLRKCEL